MAKMRLKLKYRGPGRLPRGGSYRSRTGPLCCNGGCGKAVSYSRGIKTPRRFQGRPGYGGAQ